MTAEGNPDDQAMLMEPVTLNDDASPLIKSGTTITNATASDTMSYEERKIQLSRSGQLIPALKASTCAQPMTRMDRTGNQIVATSNSAS